MPAPTDRRSDYLERKAIIENVALNILEDAPTKAYTRNKLAHMIAWAASVSKSNARDRLRDAEDDASETLNWCYDAQARRFRWNPQVREIRGTVGEAATRVCQIRAYRGELPFLQRLKKFLDIIELGQCGEGRCCMEQLKSMLSGVKDGE